MSNIPLCYLGNVLVHLFEYQQIVPVVNEFTLFTIGRYIPPLILTLFTVTNEQVKLMTHRCGQWSVYYILLGKPHTMWNYGIPFIWCVSSPVKPWVNIVLHMYGQHSQFCICTSHLLECICCTLCMFYTTTQKCIHLVYLVYRSFVLPMTCTWHVT